MRNITKKWIIITVAAVTAFGVLTACTKTTEKKDDTEEAEDVAQSEDTDSEGAQTAEDTDMQEAGPESGSENADSGEATELNGLIAEVPDDSFIIEKLVVEQENGVDIMGTDPDGTKITIVYSDETNFVKRTVQDGGDSTEEKEGSAADLQEGFTVEARGSYGGDNVFFATDVKIVEVIL